MRSQLQFTVTLNSDTLEYDIDNPELTVRWVDGHLRIDRKPKDVSEIPTRPRMDINVFYDEALPIPPSAIVRKTRTWIARGGTFDAPIFSADQLES